MFDSVHVDPDTMPTDTHAWYGWHRHECPKCKFIWAHDGSKSQRLGAEGYAKAHTCTRCGYHEKRGDTYWCL